MLLGIQGLIQNNTLYKDLVLKCSTTVFYTKTLNNNKNIRTNIGISLDQDSLSWPWLMLTGKKRKNDYGVSLSSLYTPSSCWFSSMNVSSINFSNPSQIHLHHWPLHCLVTITNYTFITEAHFFACEIVFVWVKTKEILSNYSETILWNILWKHENHFSFMLFLIVAPDLPLSFPKRNKLYKRVFTKSALTRLFSSKQQL